MVDIASCIPMQQEDPEEKPFETLREGMTNDWLEEIVDQDDSERSWTANNIMRIRMRRARTQRENQEHQDSLDAEEEGLATRLVTGVFPGDGKAEKRRKPSMDDLRREHRRSKIEWEKRPKKRPEKVDTMYSTVERLSKHSNLILSTVKWNVELQARLEKLEKEVAFNMKDSIAFLTAEGNFRKDELTGLRKDCQDLKERLENVLDTIKEELDALQDGVALALNENAEHAQEHLEFTPRRKPTVISNADFDDGASNSECLRRTPDGEGFFFCDGEGCEICEQPANTESRRIHVVLD